MEYSFIGIRFISLQYFVQILSISQKYGQLYKVTPVKGNAFIVSSSDMITLKVSAGCNNGILRGLPTGYILDVSISEYFNLSATGREKLKIYRAPVEFPAQPVPIDPYLIGYWLGDGISTKSAITTADAMILSYFRDALGPLNFILQKLSDEYSWSIKYNGKCEKDCNIFLNTLRDLDLLDNKHIPDVYMKNSVEVRRALLAGKFSFSYFM